MAEAVNKRAPGMESWSGTKYNCDAIRGKITVYLVNTKTTSSDFVKELQIQQRSYSSFILQEGPHARVRNPTSKAAHHFFVKRDAEGETNSPANKAAGSSKSKKTTSQAKAGDKSKDKDVENDVPSFDDLPKLDGELTGSVSVWDTCNDVRSKIEVHLKETGRSNAAFCQEISQCLPKRKVSGSILQAFLDKKGKENPNEGNTSSAFYASYVYFEKLRLYKGEEKSERRKGMEIAWAEEGGVDLKHDLLRQEYTVGPGETMWLDEYGQVQFGWYKYFNITKDDHGELVTFF